MSIIKHLLSYFIKLNIYKSYQPLSINEVVLKVAAHVLLPHASDHMLPRPPARSLFLPSNFWKSSGTVSFPPRKIPPADVTSACLKHAIPFTARLGKMFSHWLCRREIPERYTHFQRMTQCWSWCKFPAAPGTAVWLPLVPRKLMEPVACGAGSQAPQAAEHIPSWRQVKAAWIPRTCWATQGGNFTQSHLTGIMPRGKGTP